MAPARTASAGDRPRPGCCRAAVATPPRPAAWTTVAGWRHRRAAGCRAALCGVIVDLIQFRRRHGIDRCEQVAELHGQAIGRCTGMPACLQRGLHRRRIAHAQLRGGARLQQARADFVAQCLRQQQHQRRQQHQCGQRRKTARSDRARSGRPRSERVLQQVDGRAHGALRKAGNGVCGVLRWRLCRRALAQQHARSLRLQAAGQACATDQPATVPVHHCRRSVRAGLQQQAIGHHRIGDDAQLRCARQPLLHRCAIHRSGQARAIGLAAIGDHHMQGRRLHSQMFGQLQARGRDRLRDAAAGQAQPAQMHIHARHHQHAARGRFIRRAGHTLRQHLAMRVHTHGDRLRRGIGGQQQQGGTHSSELHWRATSRTRPAGSCCSKASSTTCAPAWSTWL